MHAIMKFVLDAAADTLRSRAELQFEILALRQQLVILKREKGRPTLVAADRIFWVFLSQIWTGWRDALAIVTPEAVVRWHRAAFRLFWTMKSRQKRRGRQPVAREVRDLIRRMSEENTSWGAPRIHGELLKLGITVSQASVSKLSLLFIQSAHPTTTRLSGICRRNLGITGNPGSIGRGCRAEELVPENPEPD